MVENDELGARFALAKKIAAEAGSMALSSQKNIAIVPRHKKKDGTWVTDIDVQIENFLRSEIGRAFPKDNVLGEESGGALSEAVWIIDPIDGTSNFIHGLPHWCVSIAFMLKGEIALGVIYIPAEGTLFAARRGYGSFCDALQLRTEFRGEGLVGAIIGIALTRKSKPEWLMPHVAALIERGASIRALGSGATALAFVAKGTLNVFVERGLHIWDCAAAIILIEEAGGWVRSSFLPHSPLESFELVAGSAGLMEKIAAIGLFK
jgi:myo-inositol-1(or 4)-monophosphatase